MTSVNPIRFRLLDAQGQPWLFAPSPDGSPPDPMVASIENRSGHDIRLSPLEDTAPGPRNFHFCLHFRPGTLSDDTKAMLADPALASQALLGSAGEDWNVAFSASPAEDGTDEIYLVHPGSDFVLSADTPCELTLLDFTSDGSQPPRSTNVEFRLTNAVFAGPGAEGYQIDAQGKSYLHLWSGHQPNKGKATNAGDGLAFFVVSSPELAQLKINDDVEFMACNLTDEPIGGAAGDHLTFAFAPPGTGAGGRRGARFQPNEVYVTDVPNPEAPFASHTAQKTPLDYANPDTGWQGDGDSYRIELPEGGLAPNARIHIKGWCGGSEITGPLVVHLDAAIGGAAPSRHSVTLMRVEKTQDMRMAELIEALANHENRLLQISHALLDVHRLNRITEAMWEYLTRAELMKSLGGMRKYISDYLKAHTFEPPKPPPSMIVNTDDLSWLHQKGKGRK